ncbi:hypothetical protein A1F94_006828 [Pyrenophora tritici-repentis]|nr:hypothetical protein PtrV1_13013 [Pyrenophora tritici-repentis]KAG9382907.1 hypothetical protein A1F94_006828 [Pyrenophora tritici-repentis]KAI0585923.1 hypothetical protein Alg215_02278 [Pyrenophora tritici-repentis]
MSHRELVAKKPVEQTRSGDQVKQARPSSGVKAVKPGDQARPDLGVKPVEQARPASQVNQARPEWGGSYHPNQRRPTWGDQTRSKHQSNPVDQPKPDHQPSPLPVAPKKPVDQTQPGDQVIPTRTRYQSYQPNQPRPTWGKPVNQPKPTIQANPLPVALKKPAKKVSFAALPPRVDNKPWR